MRRYVRREYADEVRRPTVDAIVEAAPKGAPYERRENFGEAIVAQLVDAYNCGARAENANNYVLELAKALTELLFGFELVKEVIRVDPVMAKRLGFTEEQCDLGVQVLLESADRSRLRQHLIDPNHEGISRPRRGRKNRVAIEIAAMVAGEYERHFGTRPGFSKEPGRNNPYLQICKILERLLNNAGVPISIGNAARAEGIRRAGRSAH